LVPLYAVQNLGRGAAGYGVLLGFFGLGAAAGGSILQHLHHWESIGPNRLVSAGTLLFAGTLTLLALWAYFLAACVEMFGAGFIWATVLSTFNSSIQLNAPEWVRGRALAVYQLTFAGGVFACSVLWGYIATHFGIPHTLLDATLALAIGFVATARFPVSMRHHANS
jgi:hypothetical protein